MCGIFHISNSFLSVFYFRVHLHQGKEKLSLAYNHMSPSLFVAMSGLTLVRTNTLSKTIKKACNFALSGKLTRKKLLDRGGMPVIQRFATSKPNYWKDC